MVVTSVGRSEARADGVWEGWTTQLAGPVLLVAATAGLLGQGAYYPSVQRPFGVLMALASLLALTGQPLCRRLRGEDREILLAGIIGIGLLVAPDRLAGSRRPGRRVDIPGSGAVACLGER